MQDNPREELAYIAGIMDGEGSIMIQRQASKAFMINRKYPNYSAGVRIGMLDPEPLQLIQKLGYGEIYLEKSYDRKRPMYRILIRRKDEIKEFLEDILPFLRVKQCQANLALEFIEKCNWPGGKPLTEEMNNLRHGYWLKMRELNGIDNSPAETERGSRLGRPKSVRIGNDSPNTMET